MTHYTVLRIPVIYISIPVIKSYQIPLVQYLYHIKSYQIRFNMKKQKINAVRLGHLPQACRDGLPREWEDLPAHSLRSWSTISGWWLTYPSEKWWTSSMGRMASLFNEVENNPNVWNHQLWMQILHRSEATKKTVGILPQTLRFIGIIRDNACGKLYLWKLYH